MLRSRLEQAFPNQVRDLHCRAASWYEAAQLVEAAIEHTFAVGDYAQVKRLLRQHFPQWMRPENRSTIQTWFEQLPQSFLQADPWLCVTWAWLVWGRGRAAEAERYLDCAQQAFDAMQAAGNLPADDPEYRSLPAEILAFRALIQTRKGVPRPVIELGERALAIVPEGASTIQAIAYLALQVAYRDLGQMDEAVRSCRLAVPAARLGEDVGTRVSTLYSLGLNLILLGRLDEAAQVYQDGLRYAESVHEARSPRYDAIYVRLAELSYEKNVLGEAEKLLEQGLQISEKSTYLWHRFYGLVLLSRLLLAQGDRQGALDALDRVEQLSKRISGAYFEDELNSYWARLSADLGQREHASAWARTSNLVLTERSGYVHIDRANQLAHILVALGRLDEGMQLAEYLQIVTRTKSYRHLQISVSALQAIGWWSRGEPERALQCLGVALSLAEPEGYVRVFLDQGQPMLELLYRARQQGLTPVYVARLISAATPGIAASPPTVQPLIEPLSVRELEVLRLLSQGKSNREIGDALFIAVGTVKKHLSNIFGKLGVENRTACAARARELGLV
jgi:LuxR family maltose regulon positive regulatory protein